MPLDPEQEKIVEAMMLEIINIATPKIMAAYEQTAAAYLAKHDAHFLLPVIMPTAFVRCMALIGDVFQKSQEAQVQGRALVDRESPQFQANLQRMRELITLEKLGENLGD